jgi:Pyruvate/2-oxoacid:ferredoxin oxidoreductase delta subunit
MDFDSLVEGPLLWISFSILIIGIAARLVFCVRAIIGSGRGRDSRWKYGITSFVRLFFPLHNTFTKRPLYATLRYVFHICLFAVPIWLSGHIMMWEESRFEWEWSALPDEWADWMTLLLLFLATLFFLRRIVLGDVRRASSVLDYFFIVMTALPFMTGYFLSHGTLDHVPFLGDNMWIIHILSGEAMIIMVAFQFLRTRLSVAKCTGCAACELSCPTGTLESSDRDGRRVFTYSHYQCVCCGSCMKTCPERAAELRHEISFKRLYQIIAKKEIRAVELEECDRCGARFAPVPQLDQLDQTSNGDYLRFCPRCRKVNQGEVLRRLSPWHGASRSASQIE